MQLQPRVGGYHPAGLSDRLAVGPGLSGPNTSPSSGTTRAVGEGTHETAALHVACYRNAKDSWHAYAAVVCDLNNSVPAE